MITPQLAFPLAWSTDGGFQTVEQDTRPEQEARIEITLRCPQGWLDDPYDEFGLPALEFMTGDLGEIIRNTLARDQPDIPAEVREAVASTHG